MKGVKDSSQIISKLHEIDGRGYGAYKIISGKYRVQEFKLSIDYVQGDP